MNKSDLYPIGLKASAYARGVYGPIRLNTDEVLTSLKINKDNIRHHFVINQHLNFKLVRLLTKYPPWFLITDNEIHKVHLFYHKK